MNASSYNRFAVGQFSLKFHIKTAAAAVVAVVAVVVVVAAAAPWHTYPS